MVKKKRMSREEKNSETIVDLINEMFKIAGHDVTFDDIKDRKDNWFEEWTMSQVQYEDWRVWGMAYLKKKYRWTSKYAEKEMAMVGLMWGLKFSDPPLGYTQNT